MKKIALSIGLMFVLGIILFSCKKVELDKIAAGGWTPNAAVPLAFSSFDVYDVFARTDIEDLVVVDEGTGALALIYKSELITYYGNDFITIADFTSSESVSLSEMGGVDVPSFSTTLEFSDDLEIDLDFDDGALVKEFKFDDGLLNLTLNSTFQHSLVVYLDIPDLKKNGNSFSKVVNISASSGTPVIASLSEHIEGYVAYLANGSSPSNKLKVNYKIVINGNGNPISSSDGVSMDFGFSSLKMDYAKGYFGQRQIGTPADSILLKVFQFAEDGYFHLINPRVHFFLTNSFGLSSKIDLNQIMTVNINTGETLPLLGFSQSHHLNYPTIMGDSAQTQINLDESNTQNLGQLVEPAPKFVVFDANIVANPDGDTGIDNFVTKDSKIRVEAEVELPLHGLAHSFKLRDTSEFTSPMKSENLESVLFRLNVDNGFPINVFITLNILDENYQQLFTISQTPQLMIDAADVDVNGKVNEIRHKTTDIILDKAQIELLDQAAYIEIVGTANTKDFETGKNVKIYDYYKLNLKLGGQFGFKF